MESLMGIDIPWSCTKGRSTNQRRSIFKHKRKAGPISKSSPSTRLRESGPRIKVPAPTRLRKSGPRVILPPRRPSTGSPSGPRVKLRSYHRGRCSWQKSRECAKIALKFFNEKFLSEQEPKYELVKARSSIMFQRKGYYHCNFIARQKNAVEPKLFFAELRLGDCSDDDPVDPPLDCRLCYILGPIGTETGLFGCTSCARYPGLVQHPRDGFTILKFPNSFSVD